MESYERTGWNKQEVLGLKKKTIEKKGKRRAEKVEGEKWRRGK